ncbi:FtsK/SpoIIIE domain-containing protein [Actinomyces sp. zg296]|uniref:FtsK/SpoIIIE domain-containing protein n=1 Tax=Actinomyces sp. zg296 TaxID=2609289 RepID=UPI001357B895|nr:FtsK/SpoIIIE domain-containing protein [Actinomyces sp. zg296]
MFARPPSPTLDTPASAARQALGRAWHMAVLCGPDAGLVLPLPASGTIGRCGALSDPEISREHLRVRCRTDRVMIGDAGSANGTRARRRLRGWRRLRRPRAFREGQRLRVGGSVLELRRRPTSLLVPAPGSSQPSGRRRIGSIIAGLLCLLVMGTIVAGALRMGGRGGVGMLMLAPMLLMGIMRIGSLISGGGARGRGAGRAGWRGRSRRRPDPSEVLLAVAARALSGAAEASPLSAPDAGAPGQEPAAWLGRRRRRTALALQPGDRLALTGTGASRAQRWWAAQVLARIGAPAGFASAPLAGGRAGQAPGASAPAAPGEPGGPGEPGDSRAPGAARALVPHSPASWRAPGAAPSAALGTSRGALDLQMFGDAESTGIVATWRGDRAELLIAPRGTGLPARALSARRAPRGAPAITDRWWEAVLLASGRQFPRRSSPAGPRGRGAPTGAEDPLAPPEGVLLGELTGPVSARAIRERWRLTSPGGMRLPAILGVGPRGAVDVDLVADGPHALLAGTTGSGKSELLTAWLLQLVLGAPPERLCLVLVDYKGGAAFGPLEDLPHTAGVLTDLDPAATARALSSLEAELRRRERLLAAHGARDLGELERRCASAPADGALAPEQAPPRLLIAVDEFATLADQHSEVLDALVRVAAQGRSLGVHLILSTQRPAGAVSPAMRANTTIRACLRVLDPADSRDVIGHDGAALLPRHPGRVIVEGCAASRSQEVLQAPWCGPRGRLEALVEQVHQAHQSPRSPGRGPGKGSGAGSNGPWRPWAPPLPERAHRGRADELVVTAGRPGGSRAGRREGVALAMTDLPEEQSLGLWHWDTGESLLVLGQAGSGRTTALDSAALGALAAGRVVHRCGAPSPLSALAQGAVGMGTVVGPDDPRRLARLWRLAAEGRLTGEILVLDDVDSLIPAVEEALGPGEGQQLVEALVRIAPATGTALLIGAPFGLANTRWAGALRHRVVLGASTPALASLAGMPRGAVTGAAPGRGALVDGAESTPIQILLPAPGERAAPGLAAARPLRLAPIPREARPSLLPAGAWAVGGDDAAPLPVPRGAVLVTGPPGSGRTTALRALEGALSAEAPGRASPLVIDDADLLPQASHAQAEAEIAAALREGRPVLVSATTERVAGSFRGPLMTLKERGSLVILCPGAGPAAQVAGAPLRGVIDPRAPLAPGRGVLVDHGRFTPLQVVRGEAAQGASGHA